MMCLVLYSKFWFCSQGERWESDTNFFGGLSVKPFLSGKSLLFYSETAFQEEPFRMSSERLLSWFQWKWLAILNFSFCISFASKNTKTETPSLLVSALRVGWPRKKWVKKMIKQCIAFIHHNDRWQTALAEGDRREKGTSSYHAYRYKGPGKFKKMERRISFLPSWCLKHMEVYLVP